MRRVVLLALLIATGCHRDRMPADELAARTAGLAATAAPGMQVLVERDGEIVLDRAYGVADVERRTPVTADTVFPIGAISMQFGAAAILQLVEARQISLEDPLAKFVPDAPRATLITVRNLLEHTSGLTDSDPQPIAAPGQRWTFALTNYLLLGKVLEVVAHAPLAEVLATRVFERAGLAHTRLCTDAIPQLAHGYQLGPPVTPAPATRLEQLGIAGGICSTARDLLAWQRALETGKVVSAASYRAMATPGALADNTPLHYGLGLSELRLGNHRRVLHAGAAPGFHALLEHFPDDHLRIITLANAAEPATDVAHALALHLLRIPPPRAVALPPDRLAAYAVAVAGPPLGRVRFSVAKDRLVVTRGARRHELVHVGDGVFESADHAIRVRFELTGGRVTRALFAEGDAIVTLTPAEAAEASPP